MSKTKERIRDSQLRYKHGLGQNFIYDDDLLSALVVSAGVEKDDDVLEVGPGSGNMTRHLLSAAHHVLSVELDERLIPLLNGFFQDRDNFTLIQGDIMRLNLPEVTKDLRKPLMVVANIPYYITTPLIQLLLTCGVPIRSLSLMVQKEVAEKMLSAPGDEGWGLLALRCQYLCDVSLSMEVSAACFTPPPKVDSAFVRLDWRDTPAVAPLNEGHFFRIAGAAFALRRKTMMNNLCATLHLERSVAAALMEEAGLPEKIRGEKLTMEELCALSDAYTRFLEAQA